MEHPPVNDDTPKPATDETEIDSAPSGDPGSSSAGFTPGTVVAGRFRIDAYLASGGMGQVYHAHDLALDVPLALKTIRPEIASNPAYLRLFKQEVLLARSVTHPNVCRIFDLSRDDPSGVVFLTMEFLRGETLASRIRARGALSAEASLPRLREMAAALDAAHRASIVHRDFKSANVMLVPDGDTERAVITDFGLASTFVEPRGTEPDDPGRSRMQEARTENLGVFSPAPGGIVGTPAYMSPEQVVGGPVGPASDLYALGVVLFEMRTGQLPFRGRTALETARARLLAAPPSPRKIAGIEPKWEAAIPRLLARDPVDRFPTGREVVLALEGQTQEDGHVVQHSLPPELDEFVGRGAELEAIARSLEGPEAARLLTLQGPGGTGKTRLVQRFGWMSLPRWSGGVWFCDLSEARTADGIVVAVASSMNVPLGSGDAVAQLGNAIAGRGKCLLIFDNFEQVVDGAAATVGEWMKRAGSASFLVTSQERLQLKAEVTHEIEPLDPTTQGVELFEVRAKGHRPGFELSDSNRTQVEEIVRRLDGLPLAIELAAARLRVLGLDQLEERLRNRFQILAGGRKGRHATLRATLDWSWELLQPWEQSAMLQVSVFDGGFTLEAAEAVVDLSGFEGDPFVLDVIQSLVDKSWLRARVLRGAPRFETYMTVQEYTTAKVPDADGTRSDLELRHGRYFADMGSREHIESLKRHGGVARLNALQAELDNLVSACRRAVERRDERVAAPGYVATHTILARRGPLALSVELGCDVLGVVNEPIARASVLQSLANAERRLGRIREAREHTEAALSIQRAAGDRSAEARLLDHLSLVCRAESRMQEARTLGEEALTLHRELEDRDDEGITLLNLAGLYQELGLAEEARPHCEAALAIHRALGNRPAEAEALATLGTVCFVQGRIEEARQRYDVALSILREVHDRAGEASMFGHLGNADRTQGRNEDACTNYERALALHRAIGDRRMEGMMLTNLGILHMELYELERAREELESAVAICRELGNRNLEGCALFNLGNVGLDQGRVSEARNHLETALAIHREVGNRRFEGAELGVLANIFRDAGQLEEAREYYLAALAIHGEVGNRSFEGVVSADLGFMELNRGQWEEARRHLEAALALHREIGEPRREGIVLGYLGILSEKEGRMDEAAERYEAALAIDREVGNRNTEAVMLACIGSLHAGRGKPVEARRYYGDSVTLFRELRNPFEVVKVLCSLGHCELADGDTPAARVALAEAESAAREVAGAELTPEVKAEVERLIEELRRGVEPTG